MATRKRQIKSNEKKIDKDREISEDINTNKSEITKNENNKTLKVNKDGNELFVKSKVRSNKSFKSKSNNKKRNEVNDIKKFYGIQNSRKRDYRSSDNDETRKSFKKNDKSSDLCEDNMNSNSINMDKINDKKTYNGNIEKEIEYKNKHTDKKENLPDNNKNKHISKKENLLDRNKIKSINKKDHNKEKIPGNNKNKRADKKENLLNRNKIKHDIKKDYNKEEISENNKLECTDNKEKIIENKYSNKKNENREKIAENNKKEYNNNKIKHINKKEMDSYKKNCDEKIIKRKNKDLGKTNEKVSNNTILEIKTKNIDKIEKELLEKGTKKDKINTLTLIIERNHQSCQEEFNKLLEMCSNERSDTVLYILKNIKELLLNNFKITGKDFIYQRRRLIAVYEINIRNPHIKKQVICEINELLKKDILFMDLIYIFVNKLGDKKDISHFLFNKLVDIYVKLPHRRNLILSGIEELYFKDLKARKIVVDFVNKISVIDCNENVGGLYNIFYENLKNKDFKDKSSFEKTLGNIVKGFLKNSTGSYKTSQKNNLEDKRSIKIKDSEYLNEQKNNLKDESAIKSKKIKDSEFLNEQSNIIKNESAKIIINKNNTGIKHKGTKEITKNTDIKCKGTLKLLKDKKITDAEYLNQQNIAFKDEKTQVTDKNKLIIEKNFLVETNSIFEAFKKNENFNEEILLNVYENNNLNLEILQLLMKINSKNLSNQLKKIIKIFNPKKPEQPQELLNFINSYLKNEKIDQKSKESVIENLICSSVFQDRNFVISTLILVNYFIEKYPNSLVNLIYILTFFKNHYHPVIRYCTNTIINKGKLQVFDPYNEDEMERIYFIASNE